MASGAVRDPVSVMLDSGARRLLDRAYAHPGQWVSTRLVDPDMRLRTRLAGLRINPDGPDNASTAGKRGGLNARSRWARGFVRALYYQHKWYSSPGTGGGWKTDRRTSPRSSSALRVEVGRHLPASPQWDPANPRAGGFPPGRAVRVQLARGGQAKDRAVRRLAVRDRIWTDDGQPAGRFSDPNLRDWG